MVCVFWISIYYYNTMYIGTDRQDFTGKINYRFCYNRNGLTQRALDAGDSAAISGSFHALSFFQSDGFAPPAPAPVTQTVSPHFANCLI